MKSKLNYIFLFLIFLFFDAKSQIISNEYLYKQPVLKDSLLEYYKVCNKAEWLAFNKKNFEANQLFYKGFKLSLPLPYHLKIFVNSLFIVNQIDSAFKFAAYGIEKFGFEADDFFNDSIINLYNLNFKFKESLNVFYSDVDKIRDISMLSHYQYNDIFFRSLLPEFNLEKFNCIKDKSDFGFNIAFQYDSLYAIPFFYKLLYKYNFPGPYDIGAYAADGYYNIQRHYTIEKEIIDSALVNNKITPNAYVNIVDYHFNWNFAESTKNIPFRPKLNYGPNLKKVNNIKIMGEIDDIEHVDERRETIGLVPLWQYAKYKNFELSDAYKKVLDKKKIKYQ